MLGSRLTAWGAGAPRHPDDVRLATKREHASLASKLASGVNPAEILLGCGPSQLRGWSGTSRAPFRGLGTIRTVDERSLWRHACHPQSFAWQSLASLERWTASPSHAACDMR
jgi:hypothetical protein